jgi:PIN domain nuclease of toxin-antitoxin system
MYIKSTKLAGFHKDPADQIIVATSIISGFPLLTADEKIIAFPDVITLS